MQKESYLGCLVCGLKFDVNLESNVLILDTEEGVRLLEFELKCPRCHSDYIDSIEDIIESWF